MQPDKLGARLPDVNKITPLVGKIIVKRLPPPSETEGGIALPENPNYKNRRCEVLRIHRGQCDVKPGDLVELIVFDGRSLDESLPDIEWCFEGDILCKVEKVKRKVSRDLCKSQQIEAREQGV